MKMSTCPSPSKSSTATALVFHSGPAYSPSTVFGFGTSSVGVNAFSSKVDASGLPRKITEVRPQ
jgi:hypothetical protein